MSKISVVMPTFNAEKYLVEAIESVLKQSFNDFEFIIVDDGSTDKTLSIIKLFKDKRIKLIENEHDFIGSLNLGLTSASGKYIARMDADDIMHIDRLKIQHAIMEKNPKITVCSSWALLFGERQQRGAVVKSAIGLLKQPIVDFLRGNLIFHPTVMIRTNFIRTNSLKYECYDWAEDYKLWVEIAKLGGSFYIESQALLYYRVSSNQVSLLNRKKQEETALRIRNEILDFLISLNKKTYSSFSTVLKAMLEAKEENLLSYNDIFVFFIKLFQQNKTTLKIKQSKFYTL